MLEIKSPVGLLVAISDEHHLTHLLRRSQFHKSFLHEKSNNALLKEVKKQLQAYFKGSLKDFSLPLKPKGTFFQEKAWEALCKIPYGETISYQEQALMIHNPKAVRAIGGANGQNPISIIIPCHRVIGKSGDLVGYGGGLKMKKFLLDLEKNYL